MAKTNPFSERVALTDSDIVNFGQKHGFHITIVDLADLNEDIDKAGKFSAIFTGNEGNEYNTLPEETKRQGDHIVVFEEQKLTKHWLGIYGNLIFDSYGYSKDYTLPSEFVSCRLYPSRVQSFDSAVCGEYVCAFLYYCFKTNPDGASKDVGKDFSLYFNFTTDRKENDKKILAWYEENKS